MKIDDVMRLVNAGFTKQEIAQMLKPADPAPTPAKDPAPAPAPAQDSKPTPAPDPNAPILAAITQLGDTMTKALQAVNLGAAMMPTNQPDDIDAIMAQIINPYGEDNENGK